MTGGGTGIGKAVSLALCIRGYTVVISSRRNGPLEATVHEGTRMGGHIVAAPVDVGDPDSVETLFEFVATTLGRIDVLFNNAGIGGSGESVENVSLVEWDAVLRTNLTGAFLCTKAAIRLMKSQSPPGGRIINNGSISAHVPRPNSAPYTVSKHGLAGLTRSTALDCRPYGIACGQIDIGNANTDMATSFAGGTLQADGSTRVEPTMDAQDVAKAVVYMAELPLDANVLFMTVMATKMPFVGRG